MAEKQDLELVYLNKDSKTQSDRISAPIEHKESKLPVNPYNGLEEEKYDPAEFPDIAGKTQINRNLGESKRVESKISEENTKIEEETKATSESRKALDNAINCSKCTLLMGYPPGSFFVTCPVCNSITATMEVLPLYCQFCKLTSYFPKGSTTVRCNCGAIYSVA